MMAPAQPVVSNDPIRDPLPAAAKSYTINAPAESAPKRGHLLTIGAELIGFFMFPDIFSDYILI